MSKKLEDKIMPNNIHIVHQQMKNDFQRGLSMMMKLQQDGVLYGDELEKTRINLREKEKDIREKTGTHIGRNREGYLVLSEDEKYITLSEFIDNIKSIDNETKNSFKRQSKKHLIEIQPEQCMIYLESIMIIIKKQQEEINQLKSKSKSKYVV